MILQRFIWQNRSPPIFDQIHETETFNFCYWCGGQRTDRAILDKFGISSVAEIESFSFMCLVEKKRRTNLSDKFVKDLKLFCWKINVFKTTPNLLKKWRGGGQGCSKLLYCILEQPCLSLTHSKPAHPLSKLYHSISAMLPKLRCKWVNKLSLP